MLSEIVQFHQLVNLVRELNKPVEMSDDSLIALDDDIILLEQQNIERLKALKEMVESWESLQVPYYYYDIAKDMRRVTTAIKLAKQAIAKAEGKE